MERLAICAIFKEEAESLLEWLQFHRMVGFDHFVLYDNASTDDGVARIQASRFSDHVTIVPWPVRPGQIAGYQDFITHHAARFDWVAFIDIDEFIHPLRVDSIRDLLPVYQGFSAVLLHWLVFGPSGHVARPEGWVMENYTQRVPEQWLVNRHVKTFARCAELLGPGATPHTFRLRGDVCDASGRQVGNVPIQPAVCHDQLVINHYFTKSREDWDAKVNRGKATTEDRKDDYPATMFENVRQGATVLDTRILRFLDAEHVARWEATEHAAASRREISAMDFLRGHEGTVRHLPSSVAGQPEKPPSLLDRLTGWLRRN